MTATPRRRAVEVAGVVAALAGLLASAVLGFRAWVRAAPSPDAPVVLLSVGADLVNDLGLHQAPYQATLVRLGARVVEVTPREPRSAAELLDGVDALVLTGGGDVDPSRYGGNPASAWLVAPERDAFETALIREALARDLPLLAVCRGHQLLNVALGGTLRAGRDDPATARLHGITPRSLSAHPIELVAGTQLERLTGGRATAHVSSFHAQVLDALAPGVRVAARAPDGVVEAIEVEGARFAIGIQWHPELAGPDDPLARALFASLLAESRRPRSATDRLNPERSPRRAPTRSAPGGSDLSGDALRRPRRAASLSGA